MKFWIFEGPAPHEYRRGFGLITPEGGDVKDRRARRDPEDPKIQIVYFGEMMRNFIDSAPKPLPLRVAD